MQVKVIVQAEFWVQDFLLYKPGFTPPGYTLTLLVT